MDEYLDLERRFSLLERFTAEELFASDVLGERLPWGKLLEGRFSVIIGRANFGKTMELKSQSQAMRADGKAALYVVLHKVLGEDVFTDALDVEDSDSLSAWKASGGELTVFVDSLDEAALGSEDGIRRALRRLGRELGWPTANLRWVLSSRPAVLSDDVLALLQQELRTTLFTGSGKKATDDDEFDSAFTEAAGPGEGHEESSASAADEAEGDVATLGDIASADAARKTQDKKALPEQLKVYRLLPLDSAAAVLYLKEHSVIAHAKETLSAARQYGLGRLAEGPGGLDILAYIDPVKSPPECLTRAFEKVVEAVQEQQRNDPREKRLDNPLPESLDEAIGLLAGASAVCQLPNIEISSSALHYREGTPPEDFRASRKAVGAGKKSAAKAPSGP